jgi:hypothetical protein
MMIGIVSARRPSFFLVIILWEILSFKAAFTVVIMHEREQICGILSLLWVWYDIGKVYPVSFSRREVVESYGLEPDPSLFTEGCWGKASLRSVLYQPFHESFGSRSLSVALTAYAFQ